LPKIAEKLSSEITNVIYYSNRYRISCDWPNRENCCSLPNWRKLILAHSVGGGLHGQKIGSEDRSRCLEGIIGLNPDHLAAKWLLNIASIDARQVSEGLFPKITYRPLKVCWRTFPKFLK